MVTNKGMIYAQNVMNINSQSAIFAEPDSGFMPGCLIEVYLDGNDRTDLVRVHKPSVREIWNHWMRQLGL